MASSYGYALYLYGYNSYVNVVDNSLYSLGSSAYTFYCSMNSSTLNLIDNIFMNDNSGPAFYVYGATYSDHNDWYTAGSTLGYWQGTSCSTISDLQSANGMDAGSVSDDPKFNSPSTGDLHGTSSSSLIAKGGVSISFITEDIDGQSRGSSKTDIGADEYSTVAADDISATLIISPAKGDCGNGLQLR